jgi:hypothetical protein
VSLEVLTLPKFLLEVVWLMYLLDSVWWLKDFGWEFLCQSTSVGFAVGLAVVLNVPLEQPMVWLDIGI